MEAVRFLKCYALCAFYGTFLSCSMDLDKNENTKIVIYHTYEHQIWWFPVEKNRNKSPIVGYLYTFVFHSLKLKLMVTSIQVQHNIDLTTESKNPCHTVEPRHCFSAKKKKFLG